jgi:hypothetical protein
MMMDNGITPNASTIQLQYNPSGFIKKPNDGHQSDINSPAHVNT